MSTPAFSSPPERSLPLPLTAIIGREREIQELTMLLRKDDVRLVTLTGTGGVGKTRLAIEVARALASGFNDGAIFVSLAAVTHPAFVIEAIALSFGMIAVSGESTGVRLRDALRDSQTLLVIDNVEHVVEAATELASLLGACPHMKIMTTSRVRMRLSGEWDYEVEPLALPSRSSETSIEDPVRTASVQLFVQRASAADSRFILNANNLAAVEEICRRLGGLPLAIELAAARVRFMPPDEMIRQLRASLAILIGGGPDLPARHRTMRNAIQWSYELLPAFQKCVFRALAVFVGSFTLDAATDVLHRAYGIAPGEVEGAIESLVDQSLVRIEATEGKTRFSMLEPLRDFATESLESSGQGDRARDAHARYFLEFVEGDRQPFGPGRVAKVQEVEREVENIYLVLGRLVSLNRIEPALRLANSLIFTFWQPRGRIHEQLIWLRRVAGMTGEGLEAERAEAYVGIGLGEARSGNFNAGFAAAENALTNARASGDPERLAWALVVKSVLLWRTGNNSEAKTLLQSALSIAQALDHLFLIGWIHHNLAVSAANTDDTILASVHFGEAQTVLQQLGDPWELADLESNFAWYLETQGEYARSADLYRHSLQEYRRLGDAWLLQFSLFTAGAAATEIGLWAQSVSMFSAMEQMQRQTGAPVPFGYADLYAGALAAATEHLNNDDFAAAWAVGESMTLDAAVAEADDVIAVWGREKSVSPVPSASLHGLSPREVEVLRLVAAGKTNRQIAEELYISVPTVKVHVRSIMGKLRLQSRTALAAFAIRHNLD